MRPQQPDLPLFTTRSAISKFFYIKLFLFSKDLTYFVRMSRGESRTSAANHRQSAATAAAGAERAADLNEEQLPHPLDVETQLDQEIEAQLASEPPARFGTVAKGEQEWEWMGGREGARAIIARRRASGVEIVDKKLKIPTDVVIPW